MRFRHAGGSLRTPRRTGRFACTSNQYRDDMDALKARERDEPPFANDSEL